jgi:hypothetical protein
MVLFKFGNGVWGGSCCIDPASCPETDSIKRCNIATGGKLKLFATQQDKIIAHSFFNSKNDANLVNAMTSIKFIALMDMPSTLTTVRGRGGLGSSNQKLVDVFWVMTTNIASSPGLQALLHFYVTVKTAKTDAEMKVIYGFPINTYSATAGANKFSRNDGALALSTGLKIYIAAGDQPLADYYGFYALRMQPFFKATGGNEIDVMVNSERAVKCYSWGSYNGAGFATIHNDAWASYFTGKYFALMQFKGLNMIVCKLGTAAGTATTGDVIVVPATQSAPDNPATVNNPLPFAVSTTPLLASSLASMKTACTGKNPAILAGTDEYLGAMTFISNANTAFAGIAQNVDVSGGDAAVTFPATITQLNDNSNSQLYDIKPKSNPTTTWLIGAAKLDALLYFKQAAAANWDNVRAVMTVCGPQAGSTLPSSNVITAGNSGTGAACTAAYMYTVGATDL